MAKVKRAPEPSEHASQCTVIEWWAQACKGYRLPEFALLAIPNGSARHVVVARKLKAEGVRAGIPDLFLAARAKSFFGSGGPADYEVLPGLWIEMKRKPNKVSDEQAAVIVYLKQQGYRCVIAWNVDEAIVAIKTYLRHHV